ncbi:MAG: flagellar FlaF family protein [Alphaproteobacteria bacterium]|jgi:flagellar biosynthesis activator protein FlaF|nr:flagellar FlaF family protein [Alphaproteobacteria bacterium]MBT4082940.1 flagellar FlaF family protein [Alphaproteobacteria bacterium]MBT4546642.1 flagellar FlaF family protein [Alphaproteobacteria bacterium]MBT7747048.1 flagellar FlaF family protein [Alphaproteobacteria bacterium]
MTNTTKSMKADIDRRIDEQKIMRMITEELIEAGNSEKPDFDYYAALHRNRSLWSALRRDVMSRANRLPAELRDQIDQLGAWVEEQTARVLRGEGRINPLIVVNRNVIDGLT